MCDFSCYGGVSEEWEALNLNALPLPAEKPLEERKKAGNEGRELLAAQEMSSLAEKVQLKDYSIPTRDGSSLEARSYKSVGVDSGKDLPIYIHLHGGGFLYGTLASEDAICSRIALGTGAVVLNVNYRHTPEYTYPIAWNDTEDAFLWTHKHIRELGGDPNKVLLGGISAGAHLAASFTLEKHLGRVAEGHAPIAGQILMIPWLVHMDCYQPQLGKLRDLSVSSYIENEHAPILPMKASRDFIDLLKIERPSIDDTKLSPGNASPSQVNGLPPTVFGIAGLDPLRDEGLLFAKLLTESGVPADIHVFKGLPHGFRRYGDRLSASKRWDEVMENGILWALEKPTPSREFVIKE